MSREGRIAFLGADGVADWVVLHGGAVAVFRTGTFAEAARLASAVAEIPGVGEIGAVLTVSGARLSVRLTRGVEQVEAAHIEVARAVSAVAAEHGAVADRSAVQEVQLAIAAKPDDLDVGFWRAVLGYSTLSPDNGVDPLGHGSTFWMQDLNPDKPLRHAMHVDVSVAREEAQRRLAAAVAAGGRVVEDSDAPAWCILADRAGNKVCIASWPDRPEDPA
jgi:4a-hydroxytetrahydrobiopterin dehydratase